MVEQPEQSEKLLLDPATTQHKAIGADVGGTTSCPARRRAAAALAALVAVDAVDAADGAADAAAAAMACLACRAEHYE